MKKLLCIYILFSLALFADPLNATYKVGVLKEWKPYYTLDEKGQPSGYAIELFEKIASNAHLKYQYVIFDSWHQLTNSIKQKQIDIIPNTGKTQRRASYLQYTQTTDLFEVGLFKHKSLKEVQNIGDMANLKIGVVEKNICTKLVKAKNNNTKHIFHNVSEAITALESHRIDILCYPKAIIGNFINELGLKNIESFGKPIRVIDRAIGVRKGEKELIKLLDNELLQLKASGEYQKIYNKWFVKQKDIAIDYDELFEILILILLVIVLVLYFIKRQNLIITKKELSLKVEEIKKKQKMHKFYLDTMNSLVVVLDTHGNILMMNRFGLEVLGFSEDEVLGKNWFEIGVLSKSQILKIKNYFEQSMQGDVDVTNDAYENEIYDKKGNRLIFKWSNSFILNDKEIAGVISSGVDITNEKKQLEIINEQSKLAAMGEMIGNIAHQWRQPLSIISTTASGAKMKKEFATLSDDEFCEYMDHIVAQTEYLSKTIDTFRDFIKEKKEIKTVVIQERIHKTLQLLEASLNNNYITLVNEIDQVEPVKIQLVMGELSQVIINLINNSKDAIKENKIEDPWIKIALKIEENVILVIIEDNGGGISDSVMPHIFEPYFTTKHNSVGTGLGLHMCYKIITESLKGKIYAKNTKDGVRFILELPKSD